MFLYVRTHWTDLPPPGQSQLQPEPAWASAYPGAVPTQPFVLIGTGAFPPKWTPPSGPVPHSEAYTVWFPVVRDADLVASGWAAGPGWAGSPPPHWDSTSGAPANTSDQGYGPGATGFRVDRMRLYIQSLATGSADFTFTVVAPNGTVIGTVTSAPGWTPWLAVPAAIADGKGIWSVVINRAAGVSAPPPTLYPTAGSPANAVSEPYVSPYNNAYEGILGVQVDGTEITVVQPSVPSFTATVGACDANVKRTVSLQVNFTPPVPTGWSYRVDWTTALAPPPPAPAMGTVGPTSVPSVSRTVDYLPGTYYPSVTVQLTPPGGLTTTTVLPLAQLVVPTCPTVVDCPDVRITASRTGLCVDANGTTGPVTFTAQVVLGTPPTPAAWTGPFTWTVRDVSGTRVPLPAPTPTGNTLTMAFGVPDRYTVTATIVRAQGCDPVILAGATTVDVARCGCPAIVGGLTAQRVDGCSFDFSASVVASGATGLTYSWDFGDGTTSSSPPPLRHTYPSGSGPRLVTLTVTGADGCGAPASTSVTLDCGGGGGCAEFGSAISATPTATDPCTFDLAVSVTGGTAASQVTWILPGGGTAVGTTARTTIPAGTTQTVTASLATPGCDPRTVSTTVTCGGSPPPPSLPGCTILLLIAMVLMAAGTVVGIVGACVRNNYVLIAGVVILAVGLILFILWALFCAGRTACSLMRVVHCLLFTLVAVVLPALSLVLAILAAIGVVSIPCMVSAFVSWGYWGAMYAWLGFIMRRVGCAPTC